MFVREDVDEEKRASCSGKQPSQRERRTRVPDTTQRPGGESISARLWCHYLI